MLQPEYLTVQKPQKSKLNQFINNLGLAAFSAIVSKTFLSPLQRIHNIVSRHQRAALEAKENTDFTKSLKQLQEHVQKVGFSSFWAHNLKGMFRFTFVQAFNFAGKELLCQRLVSGIDVNREKGRFFGLTFLGAGIVGVTVTSIIYTYDFTMISLRNDLMRPKEQRKYKGIIDFWVQNLKQRPSKGVSNYNNLTMLSHFLFRGLYFSCYDMGKLLLKGKRSQDPSIISKIILSQMVTTLAFVSSLFIDQVRYQLFLDHPREKESRKFKGFVDCCYKVFMEASWDGFKHKCIENVWRQGRMALSLVLFDTLQQKTVIF